VTGTDPLSEAVAELYAADPDAFTERRGILAAQARAAGDAAAGKRIAGLRKPTRSAWVINRLVRADPSVPSRLATLGDELRDAERSLDGARIRALSLARRQLIDDLVRQALALVQRPAPAALREEVTATFAAALADPRVAGQLAAGTLLRVERRAGFGSDVAPVLTLVPPPADSPALPAGETQAAPAGKRRAAPSERARAPAATKPAAPPAGTAKAAEARKTAAAQARKTAAAQAGVAAAAQAQEAAAAQAQEAAAAQAREAAAAQAREAAAAAERERRRAIADAEQAAAGAAQAFEAAVNAEREQERAVRLLEGQLAEARQRLSSLRLQARRAESEQRKARRVADRLRG
jgi:hypothetical protein